MAICTWPAKTWDRVWRSSLQQKFCLLLSISALVWGMKYMLYTYGTISPPATYWFTKPFPGLTDRDYPPEGWTPPFRVVVSLTTTPFRLSKVSNSINSLLEQSLPADLIYLNVPEGPMKRHPEKSYDEVAIPSDIMENDRVYVLRTIDYGPATKLIPALIKERENPDTLVITVDDDFVYPPRLLEALVWEAYHRPDDALGVCGWGTMPVLGSIGMVPVYVPYFMRPNGRYVDILQACCGNAYRVRFFHDVKQLIDIPDVCVTVDDVWIAGVLAVEENVKRAIISKRLDPVDPPWKIEEYKSFAHQMSLSSFNDAHEIHFKCVKAIEETFQRPWTRVYQETDLY